MCTSVHAKYKRLLQKLVVNCSDMTLYPIVYTAFILFIIHEVLCGFLAFIHFIVFAFSIFSPFYTFTSGMIAIFTMKCWEKLQNRIVYTQS